MNQVPVRARQCCSISCPSSLRRYFRRYADPVRRSFAQRMRRKIDLSDQRQIALFRPAETEIRRPAAVRRDLLRTSLAGRATSKSAKRPFIRDSSHQVLHLQSNSCLCSIAYIRLSLRSSGRIPTVGSAFLTAKQAGTGARNFPSASAPVGAVKQFRLGAVDFPGLDPQCRTNNEAVMSADGLLLGVETMVYALSSVDSVRIESQLQ